MSAVNASQLEQSGLSVFFMLHLAAACSTLKQYFSRHIKNKLVFPPDPLAFSSPSLGPPRPSQGRLPTNGGRPSPSVGLFQTPGADSDHLNRYSRPPPGPPPTSVRPLLGLPRFSLSRRRPPGRFPTLPGSAPPPPPPILEGVRPGASGSPSTLRGFAPDPPGFALDPGVWN